MTTGIEADVAAHPALTLWIIGALAAMLAAAVAAIWRLLWPRINRTDVLTDDHCEACRGDLEMRLADGDVKFRLILDEQRRQGVALMLLCERVGISSDRIKESQRLQGGTQ